jgi:hypothetical protein
MGLIFKNGFLTFAYGRLIASLSASDNEAGRDHRAPRGAGRAPFKGNSVGVAVVCGGGDRQQRRRSNGVHITTIGTQAARMHGIAPIVMACLRQSRVG